MPRSRTARATRVTFKEVYFPACAEARSRSLSWQKTQKKEFVALARKLHDAEAS